MASGTPASPLTVAIAGASQITLGPPVQYTATIAGSASSAVTWTIVGASTAENYGTISASGLYTLPPAVPVHNQIAIVATSQIDPTKSFSTPVTISNPIPAITSATLTPAYHSSFLVDVRGSGFMPSSALQYGGYGRATTYVSANELQFTMTDAPAPGASAQIGVITPAPGRTQSTPFSVMVPAAVNVTITGDAIAAAGQATYQYVATVTGTTNLALTWTIAGTSAAEDYGTISQAGLYTPPATVPVHQQISIIATSKADTTKSAMAALTIQQPTPMIVSATLTPAAGGNFVVDVEGSNFLPASSARPGTYGFPTTYVSGNELKFTLTGSPAAGTSFPLTIANPAPGKTVSAVYNLVVPGSIGVSVTGAAISAIGTAAQYTASVTGTSNTAATWSITGTSSAENYGTISSSGVYTPPATVPVHGNISIVATSVADSTKSGMVGVMIQQPVPVITGTTMTPAAKGGYLVDVNGSGFVPNSSAMPGSYGVATQYISSTHLQFTLTNPPASGTVVLLSVVNPAPGRTQSATYNLLISTTVSVSIAGTAQATIGVPVQYTASVSNTTNTAVKWAMSGPSTTENYGTLTASGLYTPPATVPAHQQFTLVATSVADTTKSATLVVNLSNPVPVITSASFTPGYHSSFLVDVFGSGFLSASQVQYLGYGAGSTYLTPTHLQFTIQNPPAAGTIEPISVITPAPGRIQSANYNLTIPVSVAVSVSGDAVATVGVPKQYLAAVTGTTNATVTWAVSGVSTAENYGSISANGLYTPPASVPAHNAISISATSKVDTTKSSSVAVNVMNAVPVIASATTNGISHVGVVFDVKGSNFLSSSTIFYSGYGLATTYVSPTELTAIMPVVTQAALTAGAPVTIWVVTANPGRTQSANFSVDLPGKVGITVTGSGTVAKGESSQYVSAVTGTTNMAVTWSVTSADGNNAASNVGTITATGLYTPPASISSNKTVTVVATSQAEASSNGTATVNLVSVPSAAAVRLLEQSTFGPSDSLVATVQSIGLSNYIDQQLALPATLMPLQNAFTNSCGSNPLVCMDEDWWNDAITAPDQLRQRVSFALSQMLVVSYEEANPAMVGAYSNILTQDAFANWSTIMKDMTVSAAMGQYLNMANSGKPAAGAIANENFARENMQLFNIGLDLLNQDGTLQTDSTGNPIPAYTEAQVEAFSRVFTGWTFAPYPGNTAVFPLYSGGDPYVPMIAFETHHDTSSKVLLNSTLPAGQTAEQDLAGAITDVFNHPNVGPFVTKQLIEHLVKSNPSAQYVGRVAAIFANDGTGVRGNMAAVVKAMLLDPEARAGDTAAAENDGYLREPILWTANVMRAFNVAPKPGVTDNSAYTAIDSYSTAQQQPVFYSPTVFNFYPASYDLAGSGLNAPQFALETSATIMTKLNLASSAVNNGFGKLMVDLSATSPWGLLASASNDLLLDELNKLFLHGTMSAQMRSVIETALSGISDPAQRVRMATYLVITSSQYKVIH